MSASERTRGNSTKFRLAPEVCYSPTTEDGCIVLNIDHGTLLSLNQTGALMFSKLAQNDSGLTRDEFVKAVLPEFEDVSASRLEAAVDDLLAQLEVNKVVRPQSEQDSFAKSIELRPIRACVKLLLRFLLLIRSYTLAALLLFLTIDSILRFGGFRSLHQTLTNWKLGRRSDYSTITSACSAVNRAGIWHPKQSLCLQRSAVLVCLLRAFGVPAEMVIGVHKMPFYSHAWAEVDGEVINDHQNVQAFFQTLCRC